MKGIDRQVATSISVQGELSAAHVPAGSTASGTGSAGSIAGIAGTDGIGAVVGAAVGAEAVGAEAVGPPNGVEDRVAMGAPDAHAPSTIGMIAGSERSFDTRLRLGFMALPGAGRMRRHRTKSPGTSRPG